MARISEGGSGNTKTKIRKKKNSTTNQIMEENRLPDTRKAYGRKGSAANQKRMIDNEANGTAWETGRKTGLPKKVKKKSKKDKAKAMSKWFH